jgi:hypothetical protein
MKHLLLTLLAMRAGAGNDKKNLGVFIVFAFVFIRCGMGNYNSAVVDSNTVADTDTNGQGYLRAWYNGVITDSIFLPLKLDTACVDMIDSTYYRYGYLIFTTVIDGNPSKVIVNSEVRHLKEISDTVQDYDFPCYFQIGSCYQVLLDNEDDGFTFNREGKLRQYIPPHLRVGKLCYIKNEDFFQGRQRNVPLRAFEITKIEEGITYYRLLSCTEI